MTLKHLRDLNKKGVSKKVTDKYLTMVEQAERAMKNSKDGEWEIDIYIEDLNTIERTQFTALEIAYMESVYRRYENRYF